MEVDGTGSRICPVVGCGVSHVEPSRSATGGVADHSESPVTLSYVG
jgi:hypothetical protein